MIESLFRTFKFMLSMLGSVRQNKSLLTPLLLNLVIGAGAMTVFAVGMEVMQPESSVAYYGIVGGATLVLYLIDYFFNGVTVSMFYDQYTKGDAKMGDAMARTTKVLPGIFTFALITTAFELLQHAARDNNSAVGRIVVGILKSFWTTAVYVVMPAMVIEGIGFGAAFSRSKEVGKGNWTQVGIGYVGMGLVSTAISAVAAAGAAYCFQNVGGLVGVIMGFLMINVFWAVSGYLKTTYYTCFYIWAAECQKAGSDDSQLAPEPLREALGGAQPAMA